MEAKAFRIFTRTESLHKSERLNVYIKGNAKTPIRSKMNCFLILLEICGRYPALKM